MTLVRAGATLAVLLTLALGSRPCPAAERTATLSSFDFDLNNPFDVAVDTTYRFSWENAAINREQICLASSGNPNCKANQVILVKELSYKRTWQILELKPRLGLYHDLEAYLVLPIWLADQSQYSYQGGVNGGNTTINPTGTPGQFLFQVPFKGPQRAGLGDLRLGLKWAPFSQQRDEDEATWLVSTEFTFPSAKVRKGGDTAVGEGLFTWLLSTSISRRFLGLLEPYFEAHAVLPFSTADSLFLKYGRAQTLVDPGKTIGITMGLEVVPWERKAQERRLSFDAGVGADYTFEGRAYSELFEALAGSPCGTSAFPTCNATLTKGGNLPTGITDISHYGAFHTWIGANLRLIRYVDLKLGFDYTRVRSHFLTNADPGKDYDNSGRVEQADEYNPVYTEGIDKIGGRFVVDGVNRFLVFVGLALKY
jgi:hypothetical protein